MSQTPFKVIAATLGTSTPAGSLGLVDVVRSALVALAAGGVIDEVLTQLGAAAERIPNHSLAALMTGIVLLATSLAHQLISSPPQSSPGEGAR